jgi:hypothetical protein
MPIAFLVEVIAATVIAGDCWGLIDDALHHRPIFKLFS